MSHSLCHLLTTAQASLLFLQSRECYQKILEINSKLQTQVKGEYSCCYPSFEWHFSLGCFLKMPSVTFLPLALMTQPSLLVCRLLSSSALLLPFKSGPPSLLSCVALLQHLVDTCALNPCDGLRLWVWTVPYSKIVLILCPAQPSMLRRKRQKQTNKNDCFLCGVAGLLLFGFPFFFSFLLFCQDTYTKWIFGKRQTFRRRKPMNTLTQEETQPCPPRTSW